MSGQETRSHVNYENSGTENLDAFDLHRMMIPIVKHHVRSHDPDVLSFSKSIKYADDLIRRVGNNYMMTKNDGKILAKKNIDPKMKRVISHIKKKLNNSKEK